LIDATLLWMILDRTPDGVLVADRTGVILCVNEPLCDLFGYSKSDLIGMPVEMLIPEDARRSHRQNVDEFAKSPKPRPMGRPDLDIEGRRADGANFPVDVQLTPVPDSDLVVASVRDVTELRHLTAERALCNIDLARARAENDRLRQSLDFVVQRLFALGMSITASASNEALLVERMSAASEGIDQIIKGVQRIRGG
jgi:PAS domain S-box-containing protein